MPSSVFGPVKAPASTAFGTVSDDGLTLTTAQSNTQVRSPSCCESTQESATAKKSSFLSAELKIPASATGADNNIRITLSQSSSPNLLSSLAKTESRSEIGVSRHPTESVMSESDETVTFFTDPLNDCDRNPATTTKAVVTQFVSITSSEPLSRENGIKVTIPHGIALRNEPALELTVPAVAEHDQYNLQVKRQIVNAEGKVGEWETVEDIQIFQGKIVAVVKRLPKSSVLVG